MGKTQHFLPPSPAIIEMEQYMKYVSILRVSHNWMDDEMATIVETLFRSNLFLSESTLKHRQEA